jgi:osmoprotectant transport system permease protein
VIVLAGVSAGQLASLVLEHLALVAGATAIATAVGVPLGILSAHRPRVGRVVVAIAGGLQVVPSLALFGLLLPVPVIGGIGASPAILALVLYALLPVVRGTMAGIASVDPAVREAAEALGLTPRQVLVQVELPLATAVIAAGVRTALVSGVGVATVAAAIGAGGLGTLIFRGLRMNDDALVLVGAVPAALLALVLDAALGSVAARLQARVRSASARPPSLRPLLLSAVAIGIVAFVALASRQTAVADGELVAAKTRPRVVVCTKDFTEQVILGELLSQDLEARGVEVVRRFELGGNLCFQALLAGTVDVYPEYTGTAYTALLGHPAMTDAPAVLRAVREELAARDDLDVSAPLGFANDFVILMRAADRSARGVRTLSELARAAPPLRAGFGQDFLSRADGYDGLVRAYGLRFAAPPREMDLSLTYRALADGQLDVIAGDSTNGLIDALDLAVIEDDRHYFPPYQAVWLTRRAAARSIPELDAAVSGQVGKLPTVTMRRLNREADATRLPPAEVARRFRLAAADALHAFDAATTP